MFLFMRADTDKEKNLHLSLLIRLAVIFAWSLINPRDILIWLLEVFPVIIGLIILTSTYRRFKFTPLAYILMWVHAIILVIGGHYTYSEMPLFNWIRDTFELSRNHYDRVGHIAQGVAPAIIARVIYGIHSGICSSHFQGQSYHSLSLEGCTTGRWGRSNLTPRGACPERNNEILPLCFTRVRMTISEGLGITVLWVF